MEIDDDTYSGRNLVKQDFHRSNRPSKCVTVCLGLLCVVLLAGNVGQVIFYMLCPNNWRKFETSCYFVSTTEKNWAESRKACIAVGADLVSIESRQEQVFVNGILNAGQQVWIGLTDSYTEGVWKWVDGTSVTTTYWQPGQPNSYGGDQDCGEFVQKSSLGEWNDEGCSHDQAWICEK
ncbi:C-type lectin domain family 4 member M-like [Acanthochromis polyacanthus]|uniref:C-type lectin domain family 4 member M-like n=1 Tax=Acanthochromis polyacanthus TaxID=80966 RepID=UPI0022349BE3|nr:C-type lectin domain family 4 member M-like [Acanthochromis polyacanthus]